MPNNRDDVVSSLLESNFAFRKLFNQHRQLDERARELDRKTFLTHDQQAEIARLKKLKLKNKDQMESIIHNYADGRT